VTFEPSSRKDDAIRRLNALLGTEAEIGVGSSVPKLLFEAAAWKMGVSGHGTMPEIGREVVEAAGLRWGPECDSTSTESGGGSTVTLTGLNRMIEAIQRRNGAL
jgi:hypothetical protein